MQNGLVVVAENVENGINGRVVRAFRRRHVHAFSPVSFHFLHGLPFSIQESGDISEFVLHINVSFSNFRHFLSIRRIQGLLAK